jgi:hypothetical protein
MGRKVAGCGDKWLQKLWRKVVLAEWGGRCAFHETLWCSGVVECHHIKRRGIPHLRHVPTNGIPLCLHHHGEAKYEYFRRLICEKIGEEKSAWLDDMERKLLPDFLAARGQSRKEWLEETKTYLQGLLTATSKGEE